MAKEVVAAWRTVKVIMAGLNIKITNDIELKRQIKLDAIIVANQHRSPGGRSKIAYRRFSQMAIANTMRIVGNEEGIKKLFRTLAKLQLPLLK